MRFFHYLIATGLGSGYSPLAPGTAGSILAVVIVYLLAPIGLWIFGSALLLLFLLGVWSGTQLEKDHGEDPSLVVIDEIVGMGISLLFLPKSWPLFLVAFLLFRLFDIFKPFPINNLQDIHGGWGIMLDDVLAGIYALAGTHLINHFFF